MDDVVYVTVFQKLQLRVELHGGANAQLWR